MVYQKLEGDEELGLLLVALRDMIAADSACIELLPDGAAGVIPEGFLGPDTPTPVILIAELGDGETASGGDTRLVRYIIYCLDRGRGFYLINRVLARLNTLLNSSETALEFLTFPPDVPMHVLSIKSPGRTATASFPEWQCEGKGLYTFITVRGITTCE